MAINGINNNTNLNVTQLKDVQVAKNKENQKAEVLNTPASQDTVKLSNQALERQKESRKTEEAQKTEVKSLEDLNRSKRLEELKLQIRNGEFKVDANAIAEKLTSNKEELGALLNR